MCYSGYEWSGSSNPVTHIECKQDDTSILPTLYYDPPAPVGTCAPLTSSCNPTCKNGGTCVSGTPTATCSCVTGFMGLDCSVPIDIFPTPCNLVHFWPMTSTHLTNQGKLADLINATTDITLGSPLYFKDNGPFSMPYGLYWGIPELQSTSPVGTLQIDLPVVPFQLNAPFTISAFVRLGPTTNWYTSYPLFSFADDGIAGNSPEITVDAFGKFNFTYTSYSSQHSKWIDPPVEWIGVGLDWRFVSIRYDHYTSKVSAWLDGQVDEITLSTPPVFNSHKLYIGSSDSTTTVWDGSISCITIYNWALSDAEVQQLKEACREVLGGPSAPKVSTDCHACTGASLPYGYLGMPDSNEYMYPAGSVVEYRTVARTWFTFPEPQRSTTTTCQSTSGLWDPTPIEVVEKAMACNPECALK